MIRGSGILSAFNLEVSEPKNNSLGSPVQSRHYEVVIKVTLLYDQSPLVFEGINSFQNPEHTNIKKKMRLHHTPELNRSLQVTRDPRGKLREVCCE